MIVEYNKICRLCLSSGEQLISIGSIFMLYDKILQLTSTPLFDGDGLPSNVCSKCCKKVTEFYKFRDMCQANFHILQKYHMLPNKSQGILDFISTHTGFQDMQPSFNDQCSNDKENELPTDTNYAYQNTAVANSIRNISAESTNLLIDSIHCLSHIEENIQSKSYNSTLAVDIKQENFTEDFIVEEPEEFLWCMPDISAFNRSSIITHAENNETDCDVTASLEEENDSLNSNCEDLLESNEKRQSIKLKRCSVVLYDCSKDSSNKTVEQSRDRIKPLQERNARPSNKAQTNSRTLCKIHPEVINFKKNVPRSSLQFVANYFTCKLCLQVFINPEHFRKHILQHAFKKISCRKRPGFVFTSPTQTFTSYLNCTTL